LADSQKAAASVPLIKRRHTQARRRSDIVAKRQEAVLSGRKLAENV